MNIARRVAAVVALAAACMGLAALVGVLAHAAIPDRRTADAVGLVLGFAIGVPFGLAIYYVWEDWR